MQGVSIMLTLSSYMLWLQYKSHSYDFDVLSLLVLLAAGSVSS